MITDTQILDVIEKRMIPHWKREDYFKSLSNKKLIKAAIKVFSPYNTFCEPRWEILEEMINRLEKQAKAQDFVAKLMKDKVS